MHDCEVLIISEAELGWQKCRAGYHQTSCDDVKSGVGLSSKGVECRDQKGWALGQIPGERRNGVEPGEIWSHLQR